MRVRFCSIHPEQVLILCVDSPFLGPSFFREPEFNLCPHCFLELLQKGSLRMFQVMDVRSAMTLLELAGFTVKNECRPEEHCPCGGELRSFRYLPLSSLCMSCRTGWVMERPPHPLGNGPLEGRL